MAQDTCHVFDYPHVRTTAGYGSQVPIDPVNVLTEVLNDLGWLQVELAEELGVDPKTVSRWMTGGTKLTERKLRTILRRINVDPSEYGLRNTLRVVSDLSDDEPPAWFVQYMEQQDARLREIELSLDTIERAVT